jgi:hypothetical protein
LPIVIKVIIKLFETCQTKIVSETGIRAVASLLGREYSIFVVIGEGFREICPQLTCIVIPVPVSIHEAFFSVDD